jgi:serpin B
MTRILRKPIPFILVSMLISPFGSRPAKAAESPVEGNTAFALDLYGQLKSKPGNLFFSPYSISTALAMTYAGARGDTEKQMRQVLHIAPDQQKLHSSFGKLQAQLSNAGKQDGIELNIANALWAQKGHPFLSDFLEISTRDYLASVQQADFKTAAEAARAGINQWVEHKTKDKIKDILPPGSLDDSTRLVLANAIYFKGTWAKPYVASKTRLEPFIISFENQIEVPLMHHFDEVRYVENNDLQAAEFPYKGGTLSMVVLLPRQVDGCSRLEARLNPDLVSGSLKEMKKQRVEIFLPKFELESDFNLNDPLIRIGMVDAFGLQADFSGMDGTRLLYISSVFHKAWGKVDEEGTEAAAATAVGAVTSGIVVEPPHPVFRADHPFIFFIRDTKSGSLLFLGRFTQPQA